MKEPAMFLCSVFGILQTNHLGLIDLFSSPKWIFYYLPPKNNSGFTICCFLFRIQSHSRKEQIAHNWTSDSILNSKPKGGTELRNKKNTEETVTIGAAVPLFFFVWQWAENFPFLSKNFSAGYSKFYSTCPVKCFGRKQFLKKYVFSQTFFAFWAKRFESFGEQFWARLSKLLSTCPSEIFSVCFRKNMTMFYRNLKIPLKKANFWWKYFSFRNMNEQITEVLLTIKVLAKIAKNL